MSQSEIINQKSCSTSHTSLIPKIADSPSNSTIPDDSKVSTYSSILSFDDPAADLTNISLTPFHLRWSFGLNVSSRVYNLTDKERTVIFYAASHAGVLYDYVTKEMQLLQGHKNLIRSISVDGTGKWLVTADEGEDSSIIIWDSFGCTPVDTIFNPHHNYGIAAIAISKNAKYLVTIGNETKSIVKFWLWTYGKDACDDSCEISSPYGVPKKICFNPNAHEHVMVTFEKQVLFFYWDLETCKLIATPTPAIKNMKKIGLITDSTYIDECHECVASTTEGYVLIFGNTSYVQNFDEVKLQNSKIFVKALKISKIAITCIESIDGIVVTGDANGQIKFYDKRMRILFWCQSFSLTTIFSISFNIEKRKYILEDTFNLQENHDTMMDFECDVCCCEDRCDSYEHLYSQLVPTDTTAAQLPFIVRNFVVATEDGQIAFIDYIHNKCNFFFKKCEAPVTAIDVHDSKPYLCIVYANDLICLYNYYTRETIVEARLPQEFNEKTGQPAVVTCLQYSPKGFHLACGKDNGSIWFLEPILAKPKWTAPTYKLRGTIMKLLFSLDSKYFACYNDNATVCLMSYSWQDQKWNILGKIKSHYNSINDILFSPYTPTRFFSVGGDRYLVEYDLKNSENGIILVLKSERIEQSAVPLSLIYLPQKPESERRYLYMSDNQILPEHNNQYLIFANDNCIGIQTLPSDGNPFKYIGTIGHPKKLLDFRICQQGKYVFTIGESDKSVLMWEINIKSAQDLVALGGPELEPYYCLIEGGMHGWLFKEMEDLFYYMQILHEGENTLLPRVISDRIQVAELPDLMRACGFYPTEFEIENMVVDVKYRHFDETKTLKDEITFLEFIQLYVNHRPAHGIPIELLKECFEDCCMAGDEFSQKTMTANSFIEGICTRGERFSPNDARTCLTTLMHEEYNEEQLKDFSFLPDVIDFDVLLADILGMDLERQCIEETDSQNGDNL